MTFKTTRGIPVLHDGDWIIIEAKNGTVYRKIDYVYPVDVFIERNVNGERRGYVLTEDDL